MVSRFTVARRMKHVGDGAGSKEEGVGEMREKAGAGAGLVDLRCEVAGDQEAEDVDGSLNEDLWLHRAGEPEMREGEGAGELLEQGAVVRPAHRENHQHSALERHALAPQLVQAGVDVGAGNPEIAPGELDGREEVEAEDGDFSDVWHCSTLPWA